jgi:hypothetical protein
VSAPRRARAARAMPAGSLRCAEAGSGAVLDTALDAALHYKDARRSEWSGGNEGSRCEAGLESMSGSLAAGSAFSRLAL